MPTWLPTRLLDQAEQRDFLSGTQPYLADLQQQVQAGISGLASSARDLAQRAMSRPITGAPMAPPGLDSGGDVGRGAADIPALEGRGYLDAATPAEGPPNVPQPYPERTPQSAAQAPQPSAIEPFTLPSFESLTGPTTAAPAPSAAAPTQSSERSPFSLPTWQDLTGFAEPIRQAVDAVDGRYSAAPAAATPTGPSSAGVPAVGGGPAPAPTGGPPRPGEIAAYIRQAAAARGIDPDVALRVVEAEGGTADPVRQSDVVYRGQREQSYGPLQLNVTGGVGSAALKAGIDPRNPDQWRQAVDFGLDEVARSGWGQWHGAARVGVGARQGIGGPRTAVPAAAAPAAAPPVGAWGEYTADTLVPHQINESTKAGMDWDTALATCGPAAAVAFARANQRTPTWDEALQLAQAVGWTKEQGMTRGTAGEVDLLGRLGVKAQAGGLDEGKIAQTVQAGQPVIVNAHGAGGHFYVATGYDPATRKFNFGNSAAVLKRSGGTTWYRLDELPSLGVGTPSEAIYMGAPSGGPP